MFHVQFVILIWWLLSKSMRSKRIFSRWKLFYSKWYVKPLFAYILINLKKKRKIIRIRKKKHLHAMLCRFPFMMRGIHIAYTYVLFMSNNMVLKRVWSHPQKSMLALKMRLIFYVFSACLLLSFRFLPYSRNHVKEAVRILWKQDMYDNLLI